jgi:hypothetical protein
LDEFRTVAEAFSEIDENIIFYAGDFKEYLFLIFDKFKPS